MLHIQTASLHKHINFQMTMIFLISLNMQSLYDLKRDLIVTIINSIPQINLTKCYHSYHKHRWKYKVFISQASLHFLRAFIRFYYWEKNTLYGPLRRKRNNIRSELHVQPQTIPYLFIYNEPGNHSNKHSTIPSMHSDWTRIRECANI